MSFLDPLSPKGGDTHQLLVRGGHFSSLDVGKPPRPQTNQVTSRNIRTQIDATNSTRNSSIRLDAYNTIQESG